MPRLIRSRLYRIPGWAVLGQNRPVAERPIWDAAGSASISSRIQAPVQLITDAACSVGQLRWGQMPVFLGWGPVGELPDRGRHSATDGAGPSALTKRGEYETTSASGDWSFWAKEVAANTSRRRRAPVGALLPDSVVLGGGTANKLKELPPRFRWRQFPTRSEAVPHVGKHAESPKGSNSQMRGSK